jgi:prefoldin subunit 1
MVRTQISTCNREIRLLQLTGEELSSLPAETRVFEGVGKMFVHREMPQVRARLDKEEKGLKGDVANLEKKMHYLETTYVNAREGLDAILKGGRG